MKTIRRSRDDRGMTILELTVASAIMLAVSAAALGMLDSATKAQRSSSVQTAALDEARTTLNRMGTEVRKASAVNQVTTTTLWLTVAVPSGFQGIYYSYDAGSKTLYRATGDSTDPHPELWAKDRVASAVANGATPVFCQDSEGPDACTKPFEHAVKVVLFITADPARSTTVPLESFFTPRNL